MKKTAIFVLVMVLGMFVVKATENYQGQWLESTKTLTVAVQDNPDSVYSAVEYNAEFPGGIDAMMKFIQDNIKYPEQALKDSVSGIVMLIFVVEKDGSIDDIKVYVSVGSGCDEEAVRIVKMMPKWTPAKDKGKAVRQIFCLPVNFQL